MTHDTLLRTAAVVAAAALLAAPYWPAIARRLAEAAKAASPYRTDIARFAAAVCLIVAACGSGVVPMVREYEWSLANVVTTAKVSVGLAFVASAFVELVRVGQAFASARMGEST